MENILFLIVGFILGVVVLKIFGRKPMELKSSGFLRLDHSDPDSPYLFIEFKNQSEADRVPQMETICFQIKREDFIPPK